jgi:cytochrome b561
MMVILPVTGIGMGYFSGKGLPFFGYTIPGKK